MMQRDVYNAPLVHACVWLVCPWQYVPQDPRQFRVWVCMPLPHVLEQALQLDQPPQ